MSCIFYNTPQNYIISTKYSTKIQLFFPFNYKLSKIEQNHAPNKDGLYKKSPKRSSVKQS